MFTALLSAIMCISSKSEVYFVDKKIVQELKVSMRSQYAPETAYLSSNDILVSTIAFRSRASIVACVLNLRNRFQVFTSDMAGNFTMCAFRMKAYDPNGIRDSIDKMTGLDELPLSASLGFPCYVTNWCKLIQFIHVPEQVLIWH